MRTEEGIVIEKAGDTARIRVGRHSECKSCGACPGNDAAIIRVKNPIGADAGQRVLFEAKETNALKGAFVVFLLPIAAAIAGAAIGALAGGASDRASLCAIAGGSVAFALACLAVKGFDRFIGRREASLARIVRVIGAPSGGKQ
ncbi:MAG: SoxR reducing system RseC family protein [Clostridiales Family XIII bacterium]|jgi:sigma-E factor negative regulatory protein RseC|nr:SoxR reducing system RseC family protein [Clostridiales Family XIII bacterium]